MTVLEKEKITDVTPILNEVHFINMMSIADNKARDVVNNITEENIERDKNISLLKQKDIELESKISQLKEKDNELTNKILTAQNKADSNGLEIEGLKIKDNDLEEIILRANQTAETNSQAVQELQSKEREQDSSINELKSKTNIVIKDLPPRGFTPAEGSYCKYVRISGLMYITIDLNFNSGLTGENTLFNIGSGDAVKTEMNISCWVGNSELNKAGSGLLKFKTNGDITLIPSGDWLIKKVVATAVILIK